MVPASAHACMMHGAFSDFSISYLLILELERFQDHASIFLEQAVAGNGRTMTPLALAMMFGVGYGALHALGPGHGKAVVSSWFVMGKARFWEGMRMAIEIALTHVVSAIVVVLIADIVLNHLLAVEDDNFRVVRLISYGLITIIGLGLLVQAMRKSVKGRCAHTHGGCAGHGCGDTSRPWSRRLIVLAVGGVPCTGAMIVLLIALAHDAILFGVLVVLGISFGMALTLTGVGVAAIWARRRVTNGSGYTWATNLEYIGACFILLFGGLLFWSSL